MADQHEQEPGLAPVDPSAALIPQEAPSGGAQGPAPPAPAAPAPSTGGSPPPSPRAQVPQDSAARERRQQNARTFLRNPKVKGSPLSRRVNFLKGKGLSPAEIVEAFAAVGEPQTLEKVEEIINNVSVPDAAAAPAPAPAPPVPGRAPLAASAPVQPAYSPQQPPQYYPQPHYSAPPPRPPPRGRDWKDYFVWATVAAGAVWGLKAVASNYLEIDIRKKGDAPPEERQEIRDSVSTRRHRRVPELSDLDNGGSSPPPQPPARALADKDELQRVERQISGLRTELEGRIDKVEQQLKDCDMDKMEDLQKRCSQLLQQSASEKGNLEKRLAKLAHVDRLPNMQQRLNVCEDGCRDLKERFNKLELAVEEAGGRAAVASTEAAAPAAGQPPAGAGAGSPRAASPAAAEQGAAPPAQQQEQQQQQQQQQQPAPPGQGAVPPSAPPPQPPQREQQQQQERVQPEAPAAAQAPSPAPSGDAEAVARGGTTSPPPS
eukprot:TRINITY_DN4844_c1_g3_i1.p1 TRINITY_DN4844_c1_g3~~TRINITY_DN4844_c1_g3_i1.p1  ORF type:complete len:517 (+),score=172.66 TRINITY_DN4844_c1_g3_i1:86-1552(+)